MCHDRKYGDISAYHYCITFLLTAVIYYLYHFLCAFHKWGLKLGFVQRV